MTDSETFISNAQVELGLAKPTDARLFRASIGGNGWPTVWRVNHDGTERIVWSKPGSGTDRLSWRRARRQAKRFADEQRNVATT